jgi:hypothetical protein
LKFCICAESKSWIWSDGGSRYHPVKLCDTSLQMATSDPI